MLEKLFDDIYRIKIPFEDIYTSAFLFCSDEGYILSDSGSNDSDSSGYIIPALEQAGIEPDWLLLSHSHSDHAGGINALLVRYPGAKLGIFEGGGIKNERAAALADNETLLGRYAVLNLTGHSPDALAVYDKASGVLVTHDCLQEYGISRYGTGVSDVAAYLRTLERIEQLKPSAIVTAHEYVPDGYLAVGAEAVRNYLSVCRRAIDDIMEFLRAHELSGCDFDALTKEFNAASALPSVNRQTLVSAAELIGV